MTLTTGVTIPISPNSVEHHLKVVMLQLMSFKVLSDVKTMKKNASLSFLEIFKGRQKDILCVYICVSVCLYICMCVHAHVKARDQAQVPFFRICPFDLLR